MKPIDLNKENIPLSINEKVRLQGNDTGTRKDSYEYYRYT